MKENVVAEKFISTLKNKTYRYMTSVSKNIYIHQLDDIVNESNNTCYRNIKTKPVDMTSNMYINLGIKNDKDPLMIVLRWCFYTCK